MNSIEKEHLINPTRTHDLTKIELILLVKQLQLELRKKEFIDRDAIREDKLKLYKTTHELKAQQERNFKLKQRIREATRCNKQKCPTVLLWKQHLKSSRKNERRLLLENSKQRHRLKYLYNDPLVK